MCCFLLRKAGAHSFSSSVLALFCVLPVPSLSHYDFVSIFSFYEVSDTSRKVEALMKYWVFLVCKVWAIGKYFFNSYYENIFDAFVYSTVLKHSPFHACLDCMVHLTWFLFCVYDVASMYGWAPHACLVPLEVRSGCWIFGTGVRSGCEPTCGFWEMKLGPLQE